MQQSMKLLGLLKYKCFLVQAYINIIHQGSDPSSEIPQKLNQNYDIEMYIHTMYTVWTTHGIIELGHFEISE